MTYRETSGAFPCVVCATGGTLIGFDPHTGARTWQRSLEHFGIILRLAFAGEHVIVALSTGLARVEARTGGVIWSRRVEVAPDTLLVHGEWIFAGSRGRIACYDLSGTLRWHDDLKGLGINPIALAVPGHVANPDFSG